MNPLHGVVPILLLSGALAPLAAGAGEDSVTTCGVVQVPPTGPTPGGLVSACLTSAVNACQYDASNAWVCQVQYTFVLRVEAPLVCGDAYSPATPGTPGNLFTCASVYPAYQARVVSAEVRYADASDGKVTVTGNFACARPQNLCSMWDHDYALPPPPPSAPLVYQVLDPPTRDVLRIVYSTLQFAKEVIPVDVHVGDGLPIELGTLP